MEELSFLVIIKRAVWQILEVIAYFCKKAIEYLIKGWWIFLICIIIPLGIVLLKYRNQPTQYSVRTQLMFCGLNTTDFVHECENLLLINNTTFVKPAKQEFVEIVDCYNDSIPDRINWLYQTTHTDVHNHLFPDRTYFIYITTNKEDKLEYLRAVQAHFRESEEYQARFQMERQQMAEESRVLHAQVNALEKSFEKGFVGNKYMPSVKSLYREMNYLDKKLYTCKEPISTYGVTKIITISRGLGNSLPMSLILGVLVGYCLSFVWVNRKKLFKK